MIEMAFSLIPGNICMESRTLSEQGISGYIIKMSKINFTHSL